MKLELTGSQQEQVVIESLGSTNINYYQNPVLGRSSVAQLLQRRGLMGFSNLVWVSGDWKGLASPFCRLGREFPERLICEPEFIRQESAHATISAAFFGPDSIGIEVVLTEAMSLFSGAPGKIHHNGGTANQQWMAFDPFRGGATLEQTSSDTILARNGEYCAVFIGRDIKVAPDGNGWLVNLPAGRFFLSAGIAYQDANLAEERARQALKCLERDGSIEPTRMRLREEWDALFNQFRFPDSLAPEILEIARNAVWCIYSNLVAPEGSLRRPAVVAAKIQYPGVYPWDSAFVALALKEADPKLAKDQIELYTDIIRESNQGQVGEMTVQRTGGGVQFPLFSWAAWCIHEAGPDRDFLKRIYEPLAKHADWWINGHGPIPGIPVYNEVVCLDDSPRFDMFAEEGRMSLREPVMGADLIAICAWDQLHLARIATALGEERQAAQHMEQMAKLLSFMDENLYSSELKRYIDVGVTTGKKGTVNTPFSHFPAMFSQSLEKQQLAADALSPQGPFWGKYGLATVSPEESSFDPCRIWRGPIWFSVNSICAAACAHAGYTDIANAIASSTVSIVKANTPLPKGIMEYYNYQTGEGSGAHHIATMSAAPLLSFLQGHHQKNSAHA